jgi:nitroreductase
MTETVEKTEQGSIENLIKSRRTINFFQPRAVPLEHLMQAIDLARWAPNHKKTEPWHFYIFGDETRNQVINLITDIKSAGQSADVQGSIKKRLDDIPGWFVMTYDMSENAITQQENYAACCCAAQNLMLYLWHMKLGVKWTTGVVTRDERFYKLLNINAAERKVVGLYWYGYPAQIPGQERRQLDTITSILD